MTTKPIYLWKSMRAGLKSEDNSLSLKPTENNLSWKIGEWQKSTDKLEIYGNDTKGFHASEKITDAISFVFFPEILAKVEVRGRSIRKEDQQCWSEMRIVNIWPWTKKDNVRLAVFTAEKILDMYGGNKPRKEIEAQKRWFRNVTAFEARSVIWTAIETVRTAGVAGAARAAAVNKFLDDCDNFILNRVGLEKE